MANGYLKVIKRPMAVLAAMVLSVGLASCGSDSSDKGSDGLTDITIGIMPIVNVMPVAMGVDKGFFKDEGLEVTLESGQGGSALVPAVVKDQYQFAYSNTVSILAARAQGLPLKVVAGASMATKKGEKPSEAIVAGPKSKIDSLDDIEGHELAVNTLHNMVEVADRVAIDKSGADSSNVEFIEMGFPDMPAALESGKIKVAHEVEPFLTQVVEDGATIISAPYRDVRQNGDLSLWFTSESQVNENPEVVDAFRKALAKSVKYARAHDDELREFIVEYLDMDHSLAKEIQVGRWPDGMPKKESIKAWYDACVKYGVISKEDLASPLEILASE